MAEGVGFEPTAQLPVHGISSAAPSATRPPLRRYVCAPITPGPLPRKVWRRGEDLNPRGTCAPIRFRVGRLQPGSATPPDQTLSTIYRLPRASRLRQCRRGPELKRNSHDAYSDGGGRRPDLLDDGYQ